MTDKLVKSTNVKKNTFWYKTFYQFLLNIGLVELVKRKKSKFHQKSALGDRKNGQSTFFCQKDFETSCQNSVCPFCMLILISY